MAENSAIPDSQLFFAMRAGDEDAFISLYRRRQGAIFRFALHMSGSAAIAEDVAQEVFLALLRSDCGFDPQRGALGAYLFGIARKLVLRYLDRDRAEGETGSEAGLAELTGDADPLSDLTRREGIEALRRAVLALPRRYREVVVLCDLEEVDYADAAAALGCPIGTVRSRLHRARALLLEKLRDRGLRHAMGTLKPARCLI